MTSPTSSSDERRAFDRLHPEVQRWVYDQGWSGLHPIQVQALPAILDGRDVILSAPTAGGKTEAAFLPILSALVGDAGGGVRCLQVSPLKALINDQYDRLCRMCDQLPIAVHRWHGDVSGAHKHEVLKDPAGVLLITPESLEALHVIHGPKLPSVFGRLSHIVVDEVHAFIGTERGRQLQSLLHRLELLGRRRVRRVGLSATLGDWDEAAKWLRPDRPEQVEIIAPEGEGRPLRLGLLGYRTKTPFRDHDPDWDLSGESVARDLYRTLRGRDHLVFANSRTKVELLCDRLVQLSERDRVPNEFYAHHGSLSKTLREEVERLLKERTQPVTVVCTSTLELGIDIGSVESVAQVGCPPSVSSLRQRLGRSGRRADAPQVLRLYVEEEEVTPQTSPPDALRIELVQTIAMVNLMLQHWVEPAGDRPLHLSTLVHQVLSLIAQHGGVTAAEAYRALCVQAPFATVDQNVFAKVLRSMGAHELIRQEPDGLLLLAEAGERLVNHFEFYAVFETPAVYRVVADALEIGSIALTNALLPGEFLLLGGRRWLVLDLDEEKKVIRTQAAAGARVPHWDPASGAVIHDLVRREMLRLYECDELPGYLNPIAADLLTEARSWFAEFGLRQTWLLADGEDVWIFPWSGDVVLNTLGLQFHAAGFKLGSSRAALLLQDTSAEKVEQALTGMEQAPSPHPLKLAATVPNKQSEKYHRFLTEELLTEEYAWARLDTVTTHARIAGRPR